MAETGAHGGGAAGSEAGGTPPLDTSDMLAVHGALRDTLAAGSTRVLGVAPDDDERRELICSYYEDILWFLHVHHDGEEELVFPKVRERAPSAAAVLDAMLAQHREVVELLSASEGALAAWRSGDGAAQERLADDLRALSEALEPHLRDEETELLPFCAQTLTAEEWGALPGHALSQYQGDKVWLVIGLIMERRTPDERQVMLAHMPPPVVQMWHDVGQRSFDEMAAEVG